MPRFLLTALLLAALLASVSCSRRMSPFSPHYPATDAHRTAATNEACRGCHDPAGLADHRPADDCRRCHRILHGD